ELTGRRVVDPQRPMLLRLSASAATEVAGLPADLTAIGLTVERAEHIGEIIGREDEAIPFYRAFVRTLAEGALDVDVDDLEDIQFDISDPREQILAMLELCATKGSGPIPDEPAEQLALAARAFFTHWDSPRAHRARSAQGLPDELPIALHVEAVRIGPGERSGYGVAVSRHLQTGEPGPHGTYYRGLRRAALKDEAGEALTAESEGYALLRHALTTLERHFGTVAKVSYEVRDAELSLLEAIPVTRLAGAVQLRLAVDSVSQHGAPPAAGVALVTPAAVEEMLHPQLTLTGAEQVFTTGLPASPGAAFGRVTLSAERVLALAELGEAAIFVATETSPADVPALMAASGVVTSNGGLASHAAVVARGAGRPAVCGASDLEVDVAAGTITAGGTVLADGAMISIDGSSGALYAGRLSIRPADPPAELQTLLGWADGLRRLGVRTNADTAVEAAAAVRLGAEGIGLCRTEHQFLGARLPLIRRLILAENADDESAALAGLAVAQREDFRALLAAMGDRPVTVRLLDAPLHEFIPHDGVYETVQQKARALGMREANSMLGLRGVRLAVLHEGLYPAQVDALVRAWADVRAEGGNPTLEIMVPLVALPAELALVMGQIHRTVAAVADELGIEVPYTVGSMIETPRAALLAGQIAEHSQFLSFGTNDLTQLTYGFSRDDVEKFVLAAYLEKGLLSVSPFATLDAEGVGALIAMAVRDARAVRPDIKLGICGEHGGDPASIEFLETLGLDYVSCSPNRVPVARLAAARAASSS
ncbi:MAG: pyruvate, orthophosphate dikinase, partial [Pseudonocardiales bacterium]|nr:pyruvate, orthophosphate dikinase [Pseudonocardiales bacterium]